MFVYTRGIYKCYKKKDNSLKIVIFSLYFINFYINILYVSDKNIEEAKENIKKLINYTQQSLDNEWEKVKKETKKI